MDRILGHKLEGRAGKAYYLVKWKEYPESEATWEPDEHIYDPKEVGTSIALVVVDPSTVPRINRR